MATQSTTRPVSSPALPAPAGPYSPGVIAGNLVFVSGMPPYYGESQFVEGDLAAQFHQVIANIKGVLETAGTTLEKIVKMNVILTRQSDFWAMNDLYRQYFKEGNYPARTTIVAGLGIPGVLVEIECVAEL